MCVNVVPQNTVDQQTYINLVSFYLCECLDVIIYKTFFKADSSHQNRRRYFSGRGLLNHNIIASNLNPF